MIDKNTGYYKLETYVDDNGRMVTEKTPMGSGNIQFIGRVLVQSQQGVVPFEFIFSDTFPTVSTCFAGFDEECNLAIDKRIEEERQRVGGTQAVPNAPNAPEVPTGHFQEEAENQSTPPAGELIQGKFGPQGD